MPMKRSGRSVTAASRVIEIEEVLLAMIAPGFRLRHQAGEDLALELLVLGRGLDHEVAVAKQLHALAGLDPAQRLRLVRLAQHLLLHLPAEEVVDPADRGVQRLARDVRQANLVARLGRHLGDAATHLPGADHADPPDLGDRRIVALPLRRPPAPEHPPRRLVVRHSALRPVL